MSVLIQGLKMPQGESCVTVRILGDGRVIGVHNDSLVKHAIELQPHGRLIDADAFLALINDSTILSDFLKCIINPLIRGEPTVIEAEDGE